MNRQMNYPGTFAPNKKLAIISLILGIVSLPTMGLLFIGGIVGVILGIRARQKANLTPEQYGGSGIALAGISIGTLSLEIGVLIFMAAIAALPIPNLFVSQQYAREVTAIGEIKTIIAAQLQYSEKKGHGKFTDIKTLAAEGLIDYQLGITSRRNGYIFACEPINIDGSGPAMFDISATPQTSGKWWPGSRSFYANETVVIYDADGTVPPSATPQDRVPRNGTPIQ